MSLKSELPNALPIGIAGSTIETSASFEPLTPTAFLTRTALVHPKRLAVVDGDLRLTYAELLRRARRLAGALQSQGVRSGDRVAVLGANSHLLLECHYGVPLAGAVLVALNIRLSPLELSYILEHSGAHLVVCDRELAGLARDAAQRTPDPPRVIQEGEPYERILSEAEPTSVPVADERGVLAINYTSGTTGHFKGVLYHHRGAYLQALAMALHSGLTSESVFLWTLPMFHCNGWCFTWAVTAGAASHISLRKFDPGEVWRRIESDGVTHFNAAPTVLASLAYHPAARRRPAGSRIRVATGGAPPAPTLLERLAELGIDVTHLYGLTETFGPIAICEWHPEWDRLSSEYQARLKSRQGVANIIAQPIRVVDDSDEDVPRDGETLGEVVVRGNDIMLGYYRDREETERALRGGWFHTGDLGVMHADGYVELRDRAKDVIISGGENIASIEVEQAILTHPSVLEAAVISVPDERWGERPEAYVCFKPGHDETAEALAAHVRNRLAGFKVPSRFEFRSKLPKTATGKIQKYRLREEATSRAQRRPAG